MGGVTPGSPTSISLRSTSLDSPYSGGGPAFREASRPSPGRSPRAWARTNRSSRADFDAAAVRACRQADVEATLTLLTDPGKLFLWMRFGVGLLHP